MIAATVNNKLTNLFRQLDKPDRKLTGQDSWAKYDSGRERDRFERLADDPSARQGTYEVSSTHHPFSPPFRTHLQVDGNLNDGRISCQQALYLDLPVRTEGEPTFLTTSQTTFTSEGATKLELVEGPEKTTARRLFSDYDEPHKDFVEEYFIAN